MIGSSNAGTMEILPKNGNALYLVTFGVNSYDGRWFGSFVGLPNADKITFTITSASVIGIGDVKGSMRLDFTPNGINVSCVDSRVSGRTVDMYATITGGRD